MAVRDPHQELLSFLRRSPKAFASRILDLAVATVDASAGERLEVLDGIRVVAGEATLLSDLLGRRRLLLEARDAERRRPANRRRDEPMLFGAKEPLGEFEPIPRISFEEAVEDLTRREPTLAVGFEEVQRVYSEKHAFAIAKRVDLATTRRVQGRLATLLDDGASIAQAKAALRVDLESFSSSYAETVYRTNLSTAYSAGRFRQAADPDVAKVIGGFEFSAVLDGDQRPNHGAANGFVASQFDRIWDVLTPPLGYNCRCGLRLVDRWELEKRGLVDGQQVRRSPLSAAAAPDSGFGRGRPDREIYGG
jgi:SPP1 gp7 family putative phage head morphogenesis protein